MHERCDFSSLECNNFHMVMEECAQSVLESDVEIFVKIVVLAHCSAGILTWPWKNVHN
jgi:hypothetical protein